MCTKEFQHKFEHTKACSDTCRKQRRDETYGFKKRTMPNLVVGKYHELKVVMDLVEKQYDVYPAMFPQALCDLIVVSRKTKQLLRIEVKTGYRSKITNHVISPGVEKQKGFHDVLAIAIRSTNEVIYRDKKGKDIDLGV